MSFFGGGSALQEKKYIITLADLLNSVVISIPKTVLFSLSMISDSSYNGTVVMEAQNTDETWNTLGSLGVSGASRTSIYSNVDCRLNDISGVTLKYPLVIRVRISLACTIGTCNIDVNYL